MQAAAAAAEAEQNLFFQDSPHHGHEDFNTMHNMYAHIQSPPRPHSPLRKSEEIVQEGLGRFSTEVCRSQELGAVPANSAVVKDSKGQVINKLCGLSEWEPRFLCVTEDKLYILHSEEDDQIADQIPLVDLYHSYCVQVSETNFHIPQA